MSVRRIKELKIDNDNKEDILNVLSRNQILSKVIEAMVFLERNPFVFHEGLNTINTYELYQLIKNKIREVCSSISSIEVYTNSSIDLYYELRCNPTLEMDSHLIRQVAEWSSVSEEQLMKRIEKENLNREYLSLDVVLTFKRDIQSYINILAVEIKRAINIFLSNFVKKYKVSLQDNSCDGEIVFEINDPDMNVGSMLVVNESGETEQKYFEFSSK